MKESSLKTLIQGNINNAILELRSLVTGAYEWKNETLPADLVKHGVENAERYLEEAKKDLTTLSVVKSQLLEIVAELVICYEPTEDDFFNIGANNTISNDEYIEKLETALLEIRKHTFNALELLRNNDNRKQSSPAPATEEGHE